MNSSTDRYEYSTLEVNTEAQARNEAQYAESTRASDLPEVNQYANPDYSYPEVVGGGAALAAAKVEIDRTPPEAVALAEGDAILPPEEPRICGVRRKVFWGLLAAAIVLIVGIVVGVTAGVVVNQNKDSGSSIGSGNGSNESGAAEEDPLALFPDTRIATANFTDGLGNENYLVAFQLNNRGIYISSWNSSEGRWIVSPVVDGNTNNLSFNDVRRGTALSLDVFRYDTSSRDVHIYWQLPDSGGLSTIKALMYPRNPGFQTAMAMPTANWVDTGAANVFVSQAGSSLISYGKQCDLCNQYTYVYWQTDSGLREAVYENATTDWVGKTANIDAGLAAPGANSSLALAHTAALTTSGHRSMDIFYRAASGALSLIVNGDGRYVGFSLGRRLGPRAGIAAFSTGYNETGGFREQYGFQVLTVDPDVAADDAAAGGVRLTSYRRQTDAWTSAAAAVAALADCAPRNTIVANRARRVYCLQGTGDDVEIVEYRWRGDPDDATTLGDYERVGTVDTTVES
ncbi:hypothetical protein GGS23DRAFT_604819 [Durotheca rogersii]|uniref:uncharacterized protein n=1 Tax=Durotheca rogersii TaxID=419775 RepID=UPI00221FB242|nr:uncharacterized protein GGS23DRAFT_604819 [Durotheca rogersii]KAI5863842.1 hypothetical protein GGS23DRAFT_604819 [Durotheca rogersii]